MDCLRYVSPAKLTLEERCKIAAAVKKYANGKPVIASGHISDSMEDQEEELKRMADTGIDALILISNRPAAQQESDQMMIERLQTLMEQLPKDIPLGFYECPYPYKRVLSKEVVKFLVDSERFYFLKDTSCEHERKIAADPGKQSEALQCQYCDLTGIIAGGSRRIQRSHGEFPSETVQLVVQKLCRTA